MQDLNYSAIIVANEIVVIRQMRVGLTAYAG